MRLCLLLARVKIRLDPRLGSHLCSVCPKCDYLDQAIKSSIKKYNLIPERRHQCLISALFLKLAQDLIINQIKRINSWIPNPSRLLEFTKLFYQLLIDSSYLVLMDEYLLDSYLDSVRVVVQKENPWSGHFLGFHHRLQIRQQAHVLRHVGGQYLQQCTLIAVRMTGCISYFYFKHTAL